MIANPYAALTPLTFAVNATRNDPEPYLWARHLEYIDRAVVDAIENIRKERIILIEAPPRHGKSEYVSHWLPAWFVGNFPDQRVMMATYADNFSKEWSRKARDTMIRFGPEYFGVDVSADVRSAGHWDIAGRRGGMLASGIGGMFTGMGANLMIVDDPIKNPIDAISENNQNKQWEWWQAVATPRMEPSKTNPLGGLAIVMMARWAQDDLIGRLLKWSDTRPGIVRRIRMPAFAGEDDMLGRQPGEILWPERIGREFLEHKRDGTDAYWWEALFQQRPGSYGKNTWPASYFEDIWADPHAWPDTFDASVIALDPSVGKDSNRGDYSATVFLGLGRGYLWVDAQVRRRPAELLCDQSVAFAQVHGCDQFGVESNSFQFLLEAPLDQACQDAGGVPLPISMINNNVKKIVRISRLGPWLARGKFKFARNPDTELLIKQLQGFPFAEHDDGPDALEMALRLLRWHLHEGGVDADDGPEEVLRV